MKPIERHGENDRSGVAKSILERLRADGGDGRLIIGLENECLAPSFEVLDNLQHLTSEDASWTYERDGSLAQHGVETVFDPSRDPMSQFMDWLIVAKAAGLKSGTATRYGCHVSIDSTCFTPLQGCFFASLINGWRQIGELVGGRQDNRWARYGIDRPSQFQYCGDKYKACSRRSPSRWEVRLFRSTVGPMRMRRYLDYINAVADVAREETPTLLAYLRRTQKNAQGDRSAERWAGYPRWLEISKGLLAKHCTRGLLAKIGGVI